jgi:hypothetical protein
MGVTDEETLLDLPCLRAAQRHRELVHARLRYAAASRILARSPLQDQRNAP